MTKQASILVVDDDISLCNLIADYLTNHSFEISCCHDGLDAINAVRENPPELLILDLMLPGIDGLGVCREIRSYYKGQILMLTALDDQADEIAGLEIGADDYLSKPVSPRLLLARVRNLLRRQMEPQKEMIEGSENTDVIQIGLLKIDRGNRIVSLGDKTIRMTTTEFDLLWLLASSAGEPLSRELLHESMYRLDLDPSDRRIDLLISRLRRKLGDDTAQPDYIKTVRGRGYQMGTGS